MRRDPERVGRFTVTHPMIDDRAAMLAILAGCIVVRAEMLWNENGIEYIALCDDFDPVPLGDITPTYRAILTENEDGTITRSRWERT